MEPEIREVPYDSAAAAELVAALQEEYVARYGGPDETPVSSAEFSPPHGVFVLALVDDAPVGCGGLRTVDEDTAEIKRMYVKPAARGQGVATST